MSGAGLEPIPISALQHWSYCPRQCALIHVEQVFADNVHTARGNAVHALVDEPGAERDGTVRIERALPLWCERLGLVGKADLVEFAANGTAYPVEYKHGPKRQRQHDDLQLAAQALCLEEMTGRPVASGAIFHFSSRRRREVMIGAELRAAVEAASVAVRELIAAAQLPPPVNDARCRHCSLIELCQPAALDDRERYHSLLSELYTAR
ncbi:MAG: CRISPR-associated exonuclease, Cas4 family [Nevskia sp.]|nr:CRISPR-associated exonuclease, Cas4 family [Nevskia sp.]